MGYSILKYGRLMLSGVENLEEARKEALRFVTPVTGSEFIETWDSANETVAHRNIRLRPFHWTKDKVQTEAWKSCRFVTEPFL